MKIQCPKISPLIFRKRKRGTYESCTVLISIYLPSQNGEDPSNCNCVFSLQVNISCPTRVKPGWHLYLAKSPERVMNSNNNKVLTFKMEKKIKQKYTNISGVVWNILIVYFSYNSGENVRKKMRYYFITYFKVIIFRKQICMCNYWWRLALLQLICCKVNWK